MHPIHAELTELLDVSRRISVDGDRVPLFVKAEMRFLEGRNQAAPMTFNIPTGEDFFATRLNLYLQSRLSSIANPDTETENTFRPTDWSSVDEYLLNTGGNNAGQYQNKYATCFFDIQTADGKKFQNAPMSILHAFSDREPCAVNSFIMSVPPGVLIHVDNYAAYVGGMDFDVEERIRAGGAWVVNITPTFTRDIDAASVDRREFAVVGILTGFKRVKPHF